jgi:hypothetical protein
MLAPEGWRDGLSYVTGWYVYEVEIGGWDWLTIGIGRV